VSSTESSNLPEFATSAQDSPFADSSLENSSCDKSRWFLFSRSFSSKSRWRSPAISKTMRWLLALLGIGLSSLLVTAFLLQPSSQGYGTHQQLGLPPCTFVVLYGRRCPACGMTTSWSHLVRGQLPSALAANVGGTLLGGIVLLAAPWSLVCAVRGRWWLVNPGDGLVIGLIVLVSVVTVSDWATRLIVQ
jgi:hypothetical protein